MTRHQANNLGQTFSELAFMTGQGSSNTPEYSSGNPFRISEYGCETAIAHIYNQSIIS